MATTSRPMGIPSFRTAWNSGNTTHRPIVHASTTRTVIPQTETLTEGQKGMTVCVEFGISHPENPLHQDSRPVEALDNDENKIGFYNGNLWADGYIGARRCDHPQSRRQYLVSR